jgi:hypothetical protein
MKASLMVITTTLTGTDASSPLPGKFMLKLVLQNILPHSKICSTFHGCTDGGSECYTSWEQSTLCRLELLVFARKWLHTPHNRNLSPRIYPW